MLFATFVTSCDFFYDNHSEGTEKDEPIATIFLDQTEIQISVGESVTLTAIIEPEDMEQGVIWKSENPDIALVKDGVVTAINEGQTIVSVFSESLKISAECSVYVTKRKNLSSTLGASQVSAISAILSGKVENNSSDSGEYTYGIQISKNDVPSEEIAKLEATSILINGQYFVYAFGLEPGVTYYFRSYLSEQGYDTYGEWEYFRTDSPIVETLPAYDVFSDKVTLYATLNLSETDRIQNNVRFGFEVSNIGIVNDVTIDDITHSMLYSISDLEPACTYSYCGRVEIGSNVYCGEKKQFTTKARFVNGVSLSHSVVTIKKGEIFVLTAQIIPSDATNKILYWSSSDESIATVKDGIVMGHFPGKATITVTTDDGSFTEQCVVYVVVDIAKSGAIDLGLSVLWGTCNLGALTPDEYGNYFAWGEVNSKDNYTRFNYLWSKGDYLTKYNTRAEYGTIDNLVELQRGEYEGESDDDAAHAQLGGKWRMPTLSEWEELLSNCVWVWLPYNGVEGFYVVSKINGNAIFLPPAGERQDTIIMGTEFDGSYWSSSLNTESPSRAYELAFYYIIPRPNLISGDNMYLAGKDYLVGISDYYYASRFLGKSIRPVLGL